MNEARQWVLGTTQSNSISRETACLIVQKVLDHKDREATRMREALLNIIALSEGYGGPDTGRMAGYRVAAAMAREALGMPEPKED